MESCSNQKSVKQMKIYVIFEIIRSSHPLPWWQLWTLLALKKTVSINRSALLSCGFSFLLSVFETFSCDMVGWYTEDSPIW
jgi:hypothetical protein